MSEPSRQHQRPWPRPWPWAWPRRLVSLFGFLVFVAAVTVYYVFVISAGHLTTWPSWTNHYDAQAEGFRAGHLYTTVEASPGLKALTDPLDPKNMPLWRWDYSYYRGRIYIYWGLLPPAILAAVKALFHVQRGVGDDPMVFAFLLVQAIAGALLVRAMARRLLPPPPAWSVGAAMLLIAFAHPTPYLLARGGVYEAAIAGGSAFMVLAFLCIFQSVFATRPPAGLRWLMLGSLCAGFAGASRVSLLPAAATTMTVAALARWRVAGGGWPRLLRLAPLAAAPLMLVTLGHMWLNKLRFDAWTEFGQSYQMGFRWLPFGARFLPANIFVYLFRPASHGCKFPYLTAEWGYPPDLFPGWLSLADEYRVNEPTAGLFLLVPVLWFLLALPLAAALGPFDRMTPGAIASDSRWRWFLAVLLVAAGGSLAVPLLAGAGTMRYQGDFAPALLLLAVVGAWAWLETTRARRRSARHLAAALLALLAAVSLIVGLLFGFSGYFNHFQRHNPALMQSLHERFDACH
ncbi:MAG TPA: hypothetical protein VFH68_18550 [Polyangia bacterium]|jgi:hypothetical protein|nr:hypothetical protein [Polyangia bacterium]